MTMTISEKLNQPFEYSEYGVNYEGNVYVGQQSVIDRLNTVIGYQNWEHEPKEIKVNMDIFSVSVLGTMRVYDVETDRWVSRTQFGNDTMTILQNETEPRAQAIEDAKKSAISDSMKKCASWFGVASDVYKGKVTAVRPKKHDNTDNMIYQALLNKFNLNAYDHRYGIVILPNSYKEFYKEKGWNDGIFQSDLQEVINEFYGRSQQTDRAKNNQNQKGYEQNSFHKGNISSEKNHANATEVSNRGSNSPQPFRIKALSAPKINQDNTAIFDALLETNQTVVVIVPKELVKDAVNLIAPNFILIVKGWLNERNGVLKLAKTGNIELERHHRAS